MHASRQLVFQMMAENRRADFVRRFRRRSLWLLSAPILLAVVAFATATAIVSQQAEPMALTGLWKASGMASFIYLIFVFLYLPSYLVGLVWFFFCTKTSGINIKHRLLAMPVITACFVWCPVMLVPTLGLEDRIQAFLALIPTALVIGWLWSFIVHWSVTWSLRKYG